jgi:hypothetical protein
MNERTTRKPYAYIAFAGDEWKGVCSPDMADKWLVEMCASGCSIKTVYSEQEYKSELARLK